MLEHGFATAKPEITIPQDFVDGRGGAAWLGTDGGAMVSAEASGVRRRAADNVATGHRCERGFSSPGTLPKKSSSPLRAFEAFERKRKVRLRTSLEAGL